MITTIGNAYTPIQNSAGGAAQVNTATLPAVAGRTNYCTGFDVSGGGATAASIVEATITGLTGGTIEAEIAAPAGATVALVAGGVIQVRFPDPIPASGPNTAINAVLPSLGAGNTNAAIAIYGQLV